VHSTKMYFSAIGLGHQEGPEKAGRRIPVDRSAVMHKVHATP
jgi:hypothetical protein